MLLENGRLAEAIDAYASVVRASQTLFENDPNSTLAARDLTVAYRELGGVLREHGKLDEALVNLRSGLQIAHQLAASDAKNVVWQQDLAALHSEVGRTLGDKANADRAMLRAPDLDEREKLSDALENFRIGRDIDLRLVRLDTSSGGRI